MLTVAEKIKALRLGEALTLKELAEKLGLKHASQIANWEKGLNGPSKDAIRALSAYFKKDKGYFIDEVADV